MTVYESRPKARVARKVWDRIVRHVQSNDCELEEIFYNPPGDGDYADRWMFVAGRDDNGGPYSKLEGEARSDLTGLSSEWTSSRGSWDYR